MAKVTINKTTDSETPSQSIVKAASQLAHVTDSRGRSIAIRKFSALDRLRMFEAIGPENSKNEQYLGYAALAFHVASIDGDSIDKPSTKMQLEALVQRLDDDGMNALAEHFEKQAIEATSALTGNAALKNE
ncbi:hypothetical protein [Limnoglobus roseus]|uniref:Uncharacterized protein n=1 Tax=Limnoglobus roseus TaxID=2598579 RepID=A0A5C1AJ70_9BACT|nr:hypothetical protein [Limnoglobus roseus]QEL18715.1 hypothetical protein PX52LOC_05751 [Limnoglobus roseus]